MLPYCQWCSRWLFLIFNFIIHWFVSKKIWLLKWDQASLFLSSEANRVITFSFSVFLPPRCSISLLLAVLSPGRGSDWGHYSVSTIGDLSFVLAGLFLAQLGLLFLVWVLHPGSGNSESCFWPLSRLPGQIMTPLYLAFCSQLANDCPHSTDGLCVHPPYDSGHMILCGQPDQCQSILENEMHLVSMFLV